LLSKERTKFHNLGTDLAEKYKILGELAEKRRKERKLRKKLK
jgi:hypothetical protein